MNKIDGNSSDVLLLPGPSFFHLVIFFFLQSSRRHQGPPPASGALHMPPCTHSIPLPWIINIMCTFQGPRPCQPPRMGPLFRTRKPRTASLLLGRGRKWLPIAIYMTTWWLTITWNNACFWPVGVRRLPRCCPWSWWSLGTVSDLSHICCSAWNQWPRGLLYKQYSLVDSRALSCLSRHRLLVQWNRR